MTIYPTNSRILLAFLIFFLGCSQKPEQRARDATPTWLHISKSQEKKDKGTTVKLEFPVITLGVDDPARARINTAMAESALTHLEQVEDDPISFDEYAKNFAADYASAKRDVPQMGEWSNESTMTIAHHGKAVVTTLCKTFTNTGGAHPNHFTHYEIYSLRDGRRLEFDEIIADGRKPGLRALVEKSLRQIHGIKSDQDLKEKGYQFTPGQLEIPQSVGLLTDGAIFHYNPYEIAPYALGHVEVPVPYKDLHGLIKPEYLP